MKKRHTKTVLLLTAIIFGAALSGCSNTNALKDAQQAFSTAAQLENKQKADTFSAKQSIQGIPAVESTAISASYSAAIDSLSKADESALKKMGLLSNAYALKAMSYWRLQKYPLALDYQQKALQLHKQENNTLGDRDLVMMSLLPSLIESDKARKKILALKHSKPTDETIKPLLNTLSTTLKSINKNKSKLAKDHPMRSYLLVSRLGAFSNYKDACDLIDRKILGEEKKAKKACVMQELCSSKIDLDELKKLHPKTNFSSFDELFIGYRCPAPQS